MATPLSVVYDAFLAKVEADDWMMNEYWDEVEKDWRQILDQAIFQFRYSRIPLDHDDVQFTNHQIKQSERNKVLITFFMCYSIPTIE